MTFSVVCVYDNILNVMISKNRIFDLDSVKNLFSSKGDKNTMKNWENRKRYPPA